MASMATSRYARLDKTGQRILCCRVDCGTELARVDQCELYDYAKGAAAIIVAADGSQHPLGPNDQVRVLRLSPGWVRDNNVMPWRMTRHATERVKRGKLPRYWRPYATAPGGTRGQHPQSTALPCLIKCPNCRQVQRLDADPLRLTHLPLRIVPVG